jgi:hypothetical protein
MILLMQNMKPYTSYKGGKGILIDIVRYNPFFTMGTTKKVGPYLIYNWAQMQ